MADKKTMPDAGSPAPDFEGKTQDGTSIRLSDFMGRKVVLYFYPKDDTPGCTKQACNLRDNDDLLREHGIVVLGVSGDDEASHRKFIGKYDLPFTLIADPDREILAKYGVWGERNLYGRKFMGLKRTTFLIDEHGIVRHVFKKPKVSDHTAEILVKFGLPS